MKVYPLFVSVYENVASMHAARVRDYALELGTSSGIISVEADSLAEAAEKLLNTPEYATFEQQHRGTIYIYCLDEQKNPCHVWLSDLNS